MAHPVVSRYLCRTQEGPAFMRLSRFCPYVRPYVSTLDFSFILHAQFTSDPQYFYRLRTSYVLTIRGADHKFPHVLVYQTNNPPFFWWTNKKVVHPWQVLIYCESGLPLTTPLSLNFAIKMHINGPTKVTPYTFIHMLWSSAWRHGSTCSPGDINRPAVLSAAWILGVDWRAWTRHGGLWLCV